MNYTNPYPIDNSALDDQLSFAWLDGPLRSLRPDLNQRCAHVNRRQLVRWA